LATISTDPDGRSTRQIADSLGRLSKVQEYAQEGSNQVLYATTQYSYDVADRMTSVLDAEGNSTDLSYDWLGRKKGMDDPDVGVWTYLYDSLGNLSQQTDNRSQDLVFSYATLGRLTQKKDLDTDNVLASYAYGATAGEIGMRTQMTDDNDWVTTWDYADFGRQVTETRTVASSQSFDFTTKTDWLGRAISTTYPDDSGDLQLRCSRAAKGLVSRYGQPVTLWLSSLTA
jgi:YD repeat-containing protein